ncbi:MAG: secondary thiamine-phosphate synthase enzyme YjbQ [Candidatus Acidiferrales bacterium]
MCSASYSFSPGWTLGKHIQAYSALKLLSVAGVMKIYNEQITLQSNKPREVFNITSRVKAAMEKSGFRDGIIVVSSLHATSSVIVSDDGPGLLEDLEAWLEKFAPVGVDYKNEGRFEAGATSPLLRLLLHHQVSVPFTESRLDVDPGQLVLFVELDGLRPRRVIVKVIGE